MAGPRGAMLVAGMLAFLVGCSSAEVVPPAATENDPTVTGRISPAPREDTVSALEDRRDPRFPDPLIDPDLVVSGGPPPDGIPAIDDPAFQRADEVAWLEDDEPVLSLTVGGGDPGLPAAGDDLARDRQRHGR